MVIYNIEEQVVSDEAICSFIDKKQNVTNLRKNCAHILAQIVNGYKLL